MQKMCFSLAAYMILAVLGTFTFAVTESLSVADWKTDELRPGGVFAPIDYAIECLAECSGQTGKTGRHPFSTARNGLPRVELPLALQGMETVFALLSLRTIEQMNHFDKKNSILLKLRI
jgi:hypothetical protein